MSSVSPGSPPDGCKCDVCPLQGRNPVLPMVPTGTAALAIIGEAPGASEEDEGEFFVGQSGSKLKAGLAHFGIPSHKVHLTNALLCRPAKELDAKEWKQALAACSGRLDAELTASGADYALALGKRAMQVCTGKGTSIRAWMGSPLGSVLPTWQGQTIPSIHPAFCLRGKYDWFPVFYTYLERAWGLASGSLREWSWPTLHYYGTDNERTLHVLGQIESKGQGEIGFDIETAGIDPLTAPIISFGLSTRKDAVSILWPPQRHFNSSEDAQKAYQLVKSILANPGIKKVAHNGTHDLLGLRSCGLPVNGYAHDTILMHHVVANTLPHNLGFACSVEFHAPRWKTLFKVAGDEKGLERFTKSPPAQLTAYNAKDSYMTLILKDALAKRMEEVHRGWELYDGYMERALIAAEMREKGVHANVDAIERLDKELTVKIAKALVELRKAARNPGLNPNAVGQLRTLFFDKLKVKPTRWTKSKLPSLDANFVQGLGSHWNTRVQDCAAALLRWRKWNKLHSTYLKGLEVREGYIHATPKVWGTKGGRWSYSGPNLQNIPPAMRVILGPGPGMYWVGADYSQLELRVLALLAGDKLLLEWYAEGRDIHTENARMLFNTENPTDEQRKLGKGFVFGSNYGADEVTIWNMLKVKFPNLTLSAVSKLKELWFMYHPAIREYQRSSVQKARLTDYVECPLSGRRQFFHGMIEPTKVYNYPIQGTGADVIDAVLPKVHEDLKGHRDGSRVLFQVHDEINTEGPNPVALASVLKEHMEQEVTLGGHTMKFPVDFKVSKRSWGECTSCDTIEEVETFYMEAKKYG